MRFKKWILILTLWLGNIPMDSNAQDYASYCPDYAEFFVAGKWESESIAFPQHLKLSGLNYSIESLEVIDEYLTYLHENNSNIGDRELVNTVIWGGCYIGEVLKRHSEKTFHWENLQDYLDRYPHLKEILTPSYTTVVVLVDDRDAMTMPLNKVARFIYEGLENNITFYASGELKYRDE